MKIIKLYSMVLENFKGISKLEAIFNGNDIKVEGNNGTGKTSLFDAFLFVLFGKDSMGNKNFAIKTIKDGEEIHNVEHSASVNLLIDDEELNLKRVYKEVYKKGRNAAEKIFNGHKTYYYINDVPVKEKEYKDKVDSIVSEDIFKLITNPMYFNELDWKEQRKILFQLAEGVEFDPIESNKDLYVLKPLLEKYSFSEALAMYKAKRTSVKNEIETIPVRIDELQKSINDYTSGSSDAEEKIRSIEKEIDDLKNQINSIENGEKLNSLKSEASSLKSDIDNLRQELKEKNAEEINRVLTKLEEIQGNGQIIQSKYLEMKTEIDKLKNQLNDLESDIFYKNEKIDSLREEYKNISSQKFNYDEWKTICDKCNRPHDTNEEEALKKHDSLIKLKKDNINEEGLKVKKQIDSLESDREELQFLIKNKLDALSKKKDLLDKAKLEKDKFNQNYEKLKSKKLDEESVNKIEQMEFRLKSKQSEIINIENSLNEITFDLKNELRLKLNEKEELNKSLSKKYAAIESQKRIDELNYKLNELLTDFDDCERYIYLLEQYNREKVENLSQSINNLFSITDFKLFKKLVNGEYEETCESLHNGVPYSKGLNNAAKINVGLDIINVLCEKYNVCAPIFVDNAESATKLLETKGQKICLYVKEGQKTLEFKGNK